MQGRRGLRRASSFWHTAWCVTLLMTQTCQNPASLRSQASRVRSNDQLPATQMCAQRSTGNVSDHDPCVDHSDLRARPAITSLICIIYERPRPERNPKSCPAQTVPAGVVQWLSLRVVLGLRRPCTRRTSGWWESLCLESWCAALLIASICV